MSHLLVDDRAESGLALDDGVWDAHLLAESWQENDELNWVNVVWNEDERSLLVLNQSNDVVETVLDSVWLLADILLLLAVLDGGGLLEETLLLLGLGLWAVLVEELEGLGGAVAVEDVVELGDGWWDLEAHVQDLALALETNILGPLDGAGEVASWLDVLADTEVAWAPLNERVLLACEYLPRNVGWKRISTYLGLLLGDTGLGGREWGRSRLLSRLWRLSLRNAISKSS